MMSATQENLSLGSFSRTHSSSEDSHISATTPEPNENDGVTLAVSDEEDDDSEKSDDESEKSDDESEKSDDESEKSDDESEKSDDESEKSDDESESDHTDDASIASYDSDFPDEYIIHDHEVRRNVPEDLEKGPSSIDFPSTSSALTTRSQNNYHDLPDLVKLEIAALVLLPENQTIRIIWNHDARVWIYRGNDIPFVQFGFPGLRAAAKEFLHRAPCLYGIEYNLLVHYPTAEFSFEYNRCGSRTEDDKEYLEAMQDAACIVERQNNTRANRIMRSLTLSWCPRHDDPDAILQEFSSIPGLERVDLETHAHYRRGTGFDRNLRDEEEASDLWHVENSLGHYPFEVRMFNHWGVQLEVNEDEEKDEWE